MQSQQKRVKWSRGETAEALEERADTGITQASVELMENCIPDIYGNISRRPALKPIPVSDSFSATGNVFPAFDYTTKYFIPFYYTENDYYLIGINYTSAPEIIRIKNGEIVKKRLFSGSVYPLAINGISSYSQQNNYMIIANDVSIYKIQITDVDGVDFTPTCDIWKFSAGWYAPNGTQTKVVNSSLVTGLNFQSNSIKNYTFVDPSGNSIVYSSIKTGISLAAVSNTWTAATTTFYVYASTQSGRVNITPVNSGSSELRATFTMTNGSTYTNGQTVATWDSGGNHLQVQLSLSSTNAYFYVNGVRQDSGHYSPWQDTTYNVTSSFANTNIPDLEQYIPVGSIVQFPNNAAYMRVEGFDSDGTSLIMYGALLTPVANNNTTDSSVNVEFGYVNLTPTSWESTTYPHPTKVIFSDQRLWAGGWAFSTSEQYALVIGSQIARYNDLKNDYNQENEPITLDILTQFKEKILHLVDYNGLKILTDSYEYAYESNGVVKQSANGSLDKCEPIIFDSLCLYVDSTGCQVKAMQYEFQSNIFNSSTINQLSPNELVWYPTAMATFEDKLNHTGKYLFVLNEDTAATPTGTPRLAVCNFVPSNQANIWNRWSFPLVNMLGYDVSRLANIVNIKNNTIFMLYVDSTLQPTGMPEGNGSKLIMPAVLDFEGNCDYETTVVNNQVLFATYDAGSSVSRTVLANATVDIFADGVYQFTATTNNTGHFTEDVSQLTNVTAGFKINATIRSHPIDVGGKTKSIKKRIGKARMSVHDTKPGAITINGKTGYMNPAEDYISFYGVTGMKQEIKYTITNNNGAMFHLESLLMNIEYGTLIS